MHNTNDEFLREESNQRQHYETMLYQERANVAVEESILCRFRLLAPKIFRDGDQWCVLYGDNLQEGIAGFGDTPRAAIIDWNAQWDAPIKGGA